MVHLDPDDFYEQGRAAGRVEGFMEAVALTALLGIWWATMWMAFH